MPTAHLIDRALIQVSGAEAEHFLQNILTADLDALGEGEAKPGALLTPQGKILFDFLISRIAGGQGFRLECRTDIAEDFIRRLTLYKLRAKVEIGKQEEAVIAVSWGGESGSLHRTEGTAAFADLRFPPDAPVARHYGQTPPADAGISAWHAFRIESGIAESGSDYALGDAFPHDVLLDQMGGVGFRKGCYVGQEVVSRMQHRGTARRRVLIARAEGGSLSAHAPVTANGKSLGQLGSVSGRSGLAIVRIDRVKDAMDSGARIEADGVPVRLSIPDWANFTFPAEAALADDA